MIQPLKPQFITVEDYDNYWNENLREKLRSIDGNDSYEAERFLARVEKRLMRYINVKTYRRLNYYLLNPRQLAAFQEALVEQAKYMFYNGDTGINSGFNQEQNDIIDPDKMEDIAVSREAIRALVDAGMFNLTVKNRPRYPNSGDPGDITNIF